MECDIDILIFDLVNIKMISGGKVSKEDFTLLLNSKIFLPP